MPTPDFSKIWASNSPLPAYTFSDADYVTGWDFVGSAPPTKNEFDAWFKLVDTKLNWLYNQMQQTASKLYPVGSVYISFEATDPATLFGGTWTRLKDRFLLASGDTYAPDTTGGSATKTISTSNLPAHSHTCGGAGEHTHKRGSMNITGTVVMSAVGGSSRMLQSTSGVFSASAEFASSYDQAQPIEGDHWSQRLTFDASDNWSGETTKAPNHTHTIGSTGSSLPLNIMPPYQTVYMWRRTA